MTAKDKLFLLESRLTLYLEAEQRILLGQSYEVEGLKLTRANLKDVQTMITKLQNDISALKQSIKRRPKFRVVRPGW